MCREPMRTLRVCVCVCVVVFIIVRCPVLWFILLFIVSVSRAC